MVQLYALEFTSNLAVPINGRKRQDFKKGDRVLVTRDEYLSLLRLGCTLIGDVEVSYDDVEENIVTPEERKEAKAQELEDLKSNAQKKAEKAAKEAEAKAKKADKADKAPKADKEAEKAAKEDEKPSEEGEKSSESTQGWTESSDPVGTKEGDQKDA